MTETIKLMKAHTSVRRFKETEEIIVESEKLWPYQLLPL